MIVPYPLSARYGFSLLLILPGHNAWHHLSHGGHVAVAAVVPNHDAVVAGHRAVSGAAPGDAAAEAGHRARHGPRLVVEHVHGPADQSEESIKHFIDQWEVSNPLTRRPPSSSA